MGKYFQEMIEEVKAKQEKHSSLCKKILEMLERGFDTNTLESIYSDFQKKEVRLQRGGVIVSSDLTLEEVAEAMAAVAYLPNPSFCEIKKSIDRAMNFKKFHKENLLNKIKKCYLGFYKNLN
jgi:hypothetical protein